MNIGNGVDAHVERGSTGFSALVRELQLTRSVDPLIGTESVLFERELFRTECIDNGGSPDFGFTIY